MTDREREVRECCKTLAGEFPDDDCDGDCQFRDALLAVLDVPAFGLGRLDIDRREQIAAAYTALGLGGKDA